MTNHSNIGVMDDRAIGRAADAHSFFHYAVTARFPSLHLTHAADPFLAFCRGHAGLRAARHH
jgi:hypothetical protein